MLGYSIYRISQPVHPSKATGIQSGWSGICSDWSAPMCYWLLILLILFFRVYEWQMCKLMTNYFKMVVVIYTSTRNIWGPADPHSLQHLELSDIFIFANQLGVHMCLIVVLICVFCLLGSLSISFCVYWSYVFPLKIPCSYIFLIYLTHVSCIFLFDCFFS